MVYKGDRLSKIATYLNENKIKTPSSLKRKNTYARNKYNPIWTISSVKSILKNQMYVGDMVQRKQTKVFYKSKKKKTLPRNNWEIVENTHEAIVDRVVFEKVQNNVKRTNITNITKREKRIFENLLFCKECGNTFTVTYKKSQNYWTINCNRYARDPKRGMCYFHFIPYDKLEFALLEVIKNTCKKYLDAVSVVDVVNEINNRKNSNLEIQVKKERLERNEREYLDKLDMLYDDKFKGLLTGEMYKRITDDTEILLNKVRREIVKLETDTKVIKNKIDDLKEYGSRVRSLIDIESPTRDFIQTIIDKIIIDKDRNIEIVYKFSIC